MRMANSLSQHDHESLNEAASLAKSLAPEDVRVGDYVTLLHMVYELPSFLWCGDASIVDRDEPVRMQLVPLGGGVPLKVKSVCLPFVFVKHPSGKQRPLDIRRCRLARLDRDYAQVAWKTYRKKTVKAKRKRKRD
jgi:hypothetical protein